MTIVGFGLFAVAIAIVFGSLLLHHDVKVVYYPRKIKVRVLSPEELQARRASLDSLGEMGDLHQALYGFANATPDLEDEELYDHDDQGRRIDVR